MADKIKAIKIKQQNGTYTGEIPISVNVQNVQWDENNHTLLDALGSVDISSSGKGNLQHQIDELDEDKISTNEFNSRLNNFLKDQISADTTDWLDDNVNPVGSAVIVDKTLTIEGAAANAKAVGDELTAVKADLGALDEQVNGQIIEETWSVGHIPTNIDPVDISNVQINTTWKHMLIEVTPGEQYTLAHVSSGNAPRAWCITDASGNVLDVADSTTDYAEQVVTIPELGAYLIVHAYASTGNANVTGVAMKTRVNKLAADLSETVKFVPQTLTEAQKEQARTNIGASVISQDILDDIIEVISTTEDPTANITIKNLYSDPGITANVDSNSNISVTINSNSRYPQTTVHNGENYLQGILTNGKRYRYELIVSDYVGSGMSLNAVTMKKNMQEAWDSGLISSRTLSNNGRYILDFEQTSERSSLGWYYGSTNPPFKYNAKISGIRVREISQNYNYLNLDWRYLNATSGITVTKTVANKFSISANTSNAWSCFNIGFSNDKLTIGKRYTAYCYISNRNGTIPMIQVDAAKDLTPRYDIMISGSSTPGRSTNGIFAFDFVCDPSKFNALCVFVVGQSGTANGSFDFLIDVEPYEIEIINEYTAIDKVARNGGIISEKITITPEEFGAKGDGSTDDTSAIQSAFNQAANSNSSVTFGPGKQYGISSTLVITKRFPIYGNNASLVALSSLDSMIRIHTENSNFPWSAGVGHIQDLTLLCKKKADCGIHCEYGWEYGIDNVHIGLPITYGVKLTAGCEWMLDRIWVYGSSVDTIGLHLGTSDSHFSNIVTIECGIGIRAYNGLNQIYGLHSWNVTPEIVKNSRMIVIANTPIHIFNCYSDTCATAIEVSGNQSVFVSGLAVHFNTSYISKSIMGDKEVYLFKLSGGASSSNIKGIGISPDSTASGLDAKFSNLTASEWEASGYMWRANNSTSLPTLFANCPN